MTTARRVLFALGGVVLAGIAAIAAGDRNAEAQRIDPRRPTVLVVGPPRGASPMQRVDARRSGFAKNALPVGPLKAVWRRSTALNLDQPALSGADGTLAVVSSRGDVTYFDEAGEEKGPPIKVGASQIGPAAMTSDGTIVFMTTSGDVMGVRRTTGQQLRFATRIGGERNVRAAPLALDDGGVVIATITDLVVLDSEGNVRSRVSLPEQPAAPLVAAGDKVIAVTTTGAVFGWTPGREAMRLGSFGAPIDGGAALTATGALLAVIDGNQVAEVDLVHGARTTWSIAPQGAYLGPPAVRDAPNGGTLAMVLGLTHTRGAVVALDASGQEVLRAPIASFVPQPLPDGGSPPLVVPPHVGPIVDARGAIAFATTDGHIGVVGSDGAVDILGETFCTKGLRPGVVGLTPFGPGAFAVTCEGGLVVRVVNAAAPARPSTPPPTAPSSSIAPSEKLRTRE